MKKLSRSRNKDPFSGSGQRLWKKAKTLIPGGNQLLSKRAEMFLPNLWPAYYSKAKGAYLWDLDGHKYLDMTSMGVGSCILGYADPDVDRAVIHRIRRGSMATLNAPEEVELAELLCEIHPWAHMVRYARTGGESMAIAARIARAYTGKDVIAFCGYHGWADWYLAANLENKVGLDEHLLKGLEPKGVPKALKGSIVPFRYNHIEELEEIIQNNPSLAAVIMEPFHGEWPKDNFLQKVRELAKKAGAVLVFDEITVGWRMTLGGAHLSLGVNPDMAIFAKSMSNGYPMAAIIGTRKVMQAAQDTFISSTYWTEGIGPTATLASIKKMKRVKLAKYLEQIGKKMKNGWERAAKTHGINVRFGGIPALQFYTFLGHDSQIVKTLFVQEMLRRGILATNAYYPSYVHSMAHVKRYIQAMDEVFAIIAKGIRGNTLQGLLKGPVAHSGFERLN